MQTLLNDKLGKMKSEEEAQKTMDKMLNARGSILGGAAPTASGGDGPGGEDEDDPSPGQRGRPRPATSPLHDVV